MKEIPIAQVGHMTVLDLVNLTDGGTSAVVITENGRQRYLFLPHTLDRSPPATDEEDLEAEASALAANPAFMAYLAECRARGEREGRVSFDEVWREFAAGSAPTH